MRFAIHQICSSVQGHADQQQVHEASNFPAMQLFPCGLFHYVCRPFIENASESLPYFVNSLSLRKRHSSVAIWCPWPRGKERAVTRHGYHPRRDQAPGKADIQLTLKRLRSFHSVGRTSILHTHVRRP